MGGLYQPRSLLQVGIVEYQSVLMVRKNGRPYNHTKFDFDPNEQQSRGPCPRADWLKSSRCGHEGGCTTYNPSKYITSSQYSTIESLSWPPDRLWYTLTVSGRLCGFFDQKLIISNDQPSNDDLHNSSLRKPTMTDSILGVLGWIVS